MKLSLALFAALLADSLRALSDAVDPGNSFCGLVRWDEADAIHCWHRPALI
jgi:hypothetical protein